MPPTSNTRDSATPHAISRCGAHNARTCRSFWVGDAFAGSLENAAQSRYTKLVLPKRPGTADAPRLALVDLRRHAVEQGLSQPAMQAIGRHLAAGGQVIVFLNRRGYARRCSAAPAAGWPPARIAMRT